MFFRTPFCHKDRYAIYMFTALGLMQGLWLFFWGGLHWIVTASQEAAQALWDHAEPCWGWSWDEEMLPGGEHGPSFIMQFAVFLRAAL